MSVLAQISSGIQLAPRRTLVHGVGGIGKTTFASQFPKPIIVQTEDGCADIDVDAFPVCKSLSDFWTQLDALCTEKHDYKTVVIDSADWLERMIWDQLCADAGHDDISDFGYGSGYAKATGILDDILVLCRILREKGIDVVVIAHSDIKKFANPNGDAYDRYLPKMHGSFSARLMEWADEVLFFAYKVHTKEVEDKMNKKRSVGIGGDRVIYTTERPAHVAKNRLNLPAEIPLSYAEYAKFRKSEDEKS